MFDILKYALSTWLLDKIESKLSSYEKIMFVAVLYEKSIEETIELAREADSIKNDNEDDEIELF
ncbi:MAG: hypothetical protein HFP81_09285 [Methylococcales symbiont of Hymedesmia sp. n. MRB-2018]|nr:MAG: hypothetical protein HFP78_06775 [Methylococcales symbiont of Hymedesmia sp. n. MRB-2018]KAF3982907.1 MAG: hypothetical protein HFP81_09285 [Methylococcales symbiont of Hymedesmia sp. n. MRB-2018]